jgi:hypothetical protein
MNSRVYCREGWLPLIERVAGRLRELDPEGRVMAAKEKMGELRIHFRSVAAASELIELAQWAACESLCTCEICGASASLRCWGFLPQTRCDRCDDEVIHG